MSKVKGGISAAELNFMISFWQRIAEEFAETESLIFEWQNYMDTRRVIESALAALPEDKKADIESNIRAFDTVLMGKTFEINESIWSDGAESEDDYDREKHWYYYRMNEPVFQAETGRFTKK
ncbi:MAG: hypothetical protein IT258_06420 [Saprospiraceae bacterium]|nr:hypothetical protein [Saprospiraceae bacterium]